MTTQDEWLLLSLCLYVLIAASTLVYAITVKKAGVLDPIVQFVSFLTLFVVPLPFRALVTKQIEGDVTEHLPQLLAYMPWAVFMTAVSLPLFVYGYYSRAAERIAARLPQAKTGRHLRAPVILLGLFSLFLLSQLAREQGGLWNFILLGYGASAEMFGKGHLAIGFPWLFVASLFLLCRYAVSKRKSDLIMFVLATMLVMSMFLLLGSRSMILYMTLTILVFWQHAIKPIRFRRLLVLAAVAFIALHVVGYIRASNYQSGADFLEKSETAYGNVETENSRMFYTLTTGEFVVPFETFPQMIQSLGRDIPPQMGLTYLKSSLLWIPTVLFPDRPLPLLNWYMQTFYAYNGTLNVSRAFFFLSEGYLNFGPLGVFVTMLAWGLFLGALHTYMRRSRGNPAALLLCALTVAFIFRGICGDFSSIFVGLPEQSLSAGVIGIWIANWRNGKPMLLLRREGSGIVIG
jgi:oligosaccharide repeat unit polymerase